MTSGQSHLYSWGSSLGVLNLPLAYWLLESGQGLWSPILAMIAGKIIFNAMLSVAMAFTTTYRHDAIGLFKMAPGALTSFVLGILVEMVWADSFQLSANSFAGLLENVQSIISRFLAHGIKVPAHGWLDLVTTAALACGLFLLASYFFMPLWVEERMRLSPTAKQQIMVIQ